MHIINCVNSVSDLHIMVANARDSQKNHEEHDFGGLNPDFLAGPEDSSKTLKRGQKWPKNAVFCDLTALMNKHQQIVVTQQLLHKCCTQIMVS